MHKIEKIAIKANKHTTKLRIRSNIRTDCPIDIRSTTIPRFDRSFRWA